MAQIQTSNEGSTSHQRISAPSPPPPRGRKIPKVPELLLKEEQNSQDYIPKVVSIGPYHNGKPELRLADFVKPMTLKMVVSENEDFYYQTIKDEINNIRDCYEQQSTDKYSDDELVRMMLLDACFIMIYIETNTPEHSQLNEMMLRENASFLFRTLGMSTMSIVQRDMFLLENQIPFWTLKLVLSSRYNKDKSQELLHRYLTKSLFREFRPKSSSPENKEELHLLEAFHRIVVYGFCCSRVEEKTSTSDPKYDEPSQGKEDLKKFVHSFRSATDLKAKGIHFRPSPTQSLKDVKFTPNWIYGKLQLPEWCVSTYTKVIFLNMTAYELSPENPNEGVMITYINLMKSLIVKPEDVKELREKKILFCTLGSDEQILKVYQDINTYGTVNPLLFQEVKNTIEAHHRSKVKIWMAELIHTYFRNPWTFITLLVATVLLVLTLLQTIYTMKS